MDCQACGHDNPTTNRFCGGCGAALARACAACAHQNPPDHRFCGTCGASLVTQPAPTTDRAEARKVVTIVFADLIGSTALHERLDPESVSRVMERYHGAVRAPVEAHGGTVVALLGDGVMCAFGVPQVAEDDAIRAVRAAVGIQQAFRAFAGEHAELLGEAGLRVAVNTGEVVVSDDYAAGIGDPLNVAARLQQEAQDGDVLIGESTERLVSELVTLAPFGVLALKGRSDTVTAYRVVSLERPAGASATAFVGRDGELRRLMAVYDAAVATPAARLAVILGSPGLGKSRLLDELARRLAGATVLTASCEAAGGATFAPIARALRTYLRIDDGTAGDELRMVIAAAAPGADLDHARIAAGIGALLAGTPASPEETFFVIRRFLAALATTQPVVLAIDDLHWAEPLLLDLLEHLVQWSTDVPLLLLVAARPELREARSSLAAPGGLVAEVVTLAGLDAGAATRLAANVIGADELPAAVAGRVLATSEGNPLFVGELVRMLVHDGALKREGERWTTGVELAGLEMPPTIQALLAARIERLRPEERTVLERAAVVGRQFSRAAVTHLLPREVADLDARLEALKRSELIEPDAGWFLGEPVLRFHHVLIRDAAYRRVLKGTRAELHARFADWLEARAGEAVEHDETIGWHLEQAHRHLRELGPIDAQGRALGERAARYLAAAGRRALARDDLQPAASLLGRALDRLDAADPARADLALDWCEALLAAGDVGPAAKAIAELERLIGGSQSPAAPAPTNPQPPTPNPRLQAWHTCFAGELAALTDPQTLRATAAAVAAAAEELAALDDAAGEAKAHSVHASALARLGKVGACEGALDRALAAARRGDDRRRSNAVLAGAPLAALWGPSPVTRASGRCLDVVRVLRITQGAPAVEAVALRCQGVLEALRGRPAAARRMIASSRRMVEELGITHRLLEADVFAGLIELLEGDAAAAERCLRPAYEGLRSHGLGIDAAQAAAQLGRALLLQDRAAEAEALSHESEALAGDDLQAAIAWRGVRAEALARRGEHAAAVDFARAAVDLAAATDALLHHADARLALAAALRAAGRGDEAAAEEARAIELWEAKGATLLAERARRAAGQTSAGRAPVEAVVSPSVIRPRMERNHATLHLARIDEAVAARDLQAVRSLLGETRVLDHVSGRWYGTDSLCENFRWMIQRAAGLAFGNEPIAVLGPSLALARWRESGSEVAGDDLPIGPFELEGTVLVEADSEARSTHVEIFPADHLGDAVARLYERYAELLPEGPERSRAAATARSIAAMEESVDVDRWATVISPALEFIDHRTLGLPSLRGHEAFLRGLQSLLDLSDYTGRRVDDVLALRSNALLVLQTIFGTARAGGDAYESQVLALGAFGPDGLLARIEYFDVGRDAEALARFEELVASIVDTREGEPPGELRVGRGGSAGASPSQAARPSRAERPTRRVRANAATAQAARVDAAIAARDADALDSSIADRTEVVDHTTGTTWDRWGELASYRALLRAQVPICRHEPLATLGDSLALCRQSMSAGGFAGAQFDVGAYEREEVLLIEVDAQARRRRAEVFASDRLGDAVVRLYERYAELLPDGPERTRTAATAGSVAALLGGSDRWRARSAPFAPDAEAHDHRTVGFGSLCGADAVLQAVDALRQLSDDFHDRFDDVLDLRSDALLVRATTSGTVRTTGGGFEQDLCQLFVFGADGLVTRWEQFDAEQDAEALARFDALAAEPPVARPVQRRLRANAATATTARADAAIAARDVDAFLATWVEGAEIIDHPTGSAYGLRELGNTWRSALLRAPDLTCRREEMATLGEALGLFRQWVRASAAAGGRFDVGDYEIGQLFLNEVDEQGRYRRSERFGVNRLGDAITRLYERYAERLPDGPARDRAAATARSVAALLAGPPDRWPFAPDAEAMDHRTVGFGSLRGADTVLHSIRTLIQLSDGFDNRIDDVLGLRSDALLVRWTNSGMDRASGGAFERSLCLLWVFGADGLATRWEQFDAEQEAEALARFDELTAGRPAPRPVRRRVQPNAATTNAARTDTVIAARDTETLPDLFADEMGAENHITHTAWDWPAVLSSWRSLLLAEDPTCRHEPLATLGDSLALCRVSLGAGGLARGNLDVGAYEKTEIHLIEADAQGRRRWTEAFASDRLGDALIRLYERYADLLPDGPARARAAATACSVAVATLQGFDLDRFGAALAPDVEFVDHRALGFPSTRGAEAYLHRLGSLLEVADDVAHRIDDVLGLRTDAVLVSWTTFGIDRASGGAFEQPICQLVVFGADGLVTRNEMFDADRGAEALARFDELVPSPSPALGTSSAESPVPVPPAARIENAATRLGDRFAAAWAGRDWQGIAASFAPDFRLIDRRRYAHLELDRDQHLESLRFRFEMSSSRTVLEVVATRGRRLALLRQRFELAGGDVGPSETESLNVAESDEHGNFVVLVTFDPDDLDAAYAELDARFAAGEAAPHGCIWELRNPRAVAGRDWEQLAAVYAPDCIMADHRPLGILNFRSRDEYVASVRALLDLRPDAALRVHHVLALDDRRSLTIAGWVGKEPEGPFEILAVAVTLYDSGGIRQQHFYDRDQLAAARARFEALSTAAATPASFENAAVRAAYRIRDAMEAGDWERFATLFPASFRSVDRQWMAQLEADRDRYLEAWRPIFETFSSSSTLMIEGLATRGDRLALGRVRWTGSGHSVGPCEFEWLGILEVDRNGEIVAEITFDHDDLEAAYAELDARYAAGEAAPYAATLETMQRLQRSMAIRDFDELASVYAADLVVEDRRLLGWGTLRSRGEELALFRALVELAPDVALRIDHVLATGARGGLAVARVTGSREGGAFEIPFVSVIVLGPDGRIRQVNLYDLDQLDAARARYDELTAEHPINPSESLLRKEGTEEEPAARTESSPDPLRIPPNAATRAMDRWRERFEAGDLEAVQALYAQARVLDDRRRLVRLTGDRDMALANVQVIAPSGARSSRTVLATAGDRLALGRVRFAGPDELSASSAESFDPARDGREMGFEIENLQITEVDAEGRIAAVIVFDPDDRRAASAEMLERYARSGADEMPAAWFEFWRAWNDHDLGRLRTLLLGDYFFHDHRRTGIGRVEGEAYIASLAALYELSPDVRLEPLYSVARAAHGRVDVMRWVGTNAEGGEFESVFVRLILFRGNRLAGLEQFELGDLDQARARLEELRATKGR